MTSDRAAAAQFEFAHLRFALAWTLPVSVVLAAWLSPWWAWIVGTGFLFALALIERLPFGRHWPPPSAAQPWFAFTLRAHVVLQAALLDVGIATSDIRAPGSIERSAGC
jgi:hypothetical protein